MRKVKKMKKTTISNTNPVSDRFFLLELLEDEWEQQALRSVVCSSLDR